MKIGNDRCIFMHKTLYFSKHLSLGAYGNNPFRNTNLKSKPKLMFEFW